MRLTQPPGHLERHAQTKPMIPDPTQAMTEANPFGTKQFLPYVNHFPSKPAMCKTCPVRASPCSEMRSDKSKARHDTMSMSFKTVTKPKQKGEIME